MIMSSKHTTCGLVHNILDTGPAAVRFTETRGQSLRCVDRKVVGSILNTEWPCADMLIKFKWAN